MKTMKTNILENKSRKVFLFSIPKGLNIILMLLLIFEISSAESGFSQEINFRTLPQIIVDKNNHYLKTSDGKQFIWFGDTGWKLIEKLSREEVLLYLDTRSKQGFNIIQLVIAWSPQVTNYYGDSAFINLNPCLPAITNGANPSNNVEYDFWDHLDFVINEILKHGMYPAVLPTWGGAIVNGQYNQKSAKEYGFFLGKRYKNAPLVWVLGGDIPAGGFEATWNEMANGITYGITGELDYSKVFMTYHPYGFKSSSSFWFHNAKWIDMNMQQTGHDAFWPVYNNILADWNRLPAKPVIDAEPSYEDFPASFHDTINRISANNIRQIAYYEFFSGAAGFTYGHNNVFQFYKGSNGYFHPTKLWAESLKSPAIDQLIIFKKLIESFSLEYCKPEWEMVVTQYDETKRVLALQGKNWAMVYTPSGKRFSIDLGKTETSQILAKWFDPLTGQITQFDVHKTNNKFYFVPPISATHPDWVLILSMIQ